MPILKEIDEKCLTLLAFKAYPMDSEFANRFDALVMMGLAMLTEDGYEITAAGCDYVSENVAGGSRPDPDAPCGFKFETLN